MSKRLIFYTLIVVVLLVLSSSTVLAATLTSRVHHEGGCQWTVTLTGSGFAANSAMYLSLTESNEHDCNGNTNHPTYSDWNVGSSDNGGNFSIAITHNGYGHYEFTLRDSAGNSSNLTVNYDSPSGSGGNANANTLQPMDIADFCRDNNFSGEPYTRGAVWYCGNGWLIPYETVCDLQYGFDYSAYSANPSDPYSWGCWIGQQTPQPQPPQESSGQPQATQVPQQQPQNGTSCVPVRSSRLNIGDTAEVSDETPDPLPLRSATSTTASILIQVPVGAELTMLDGPFCDGNILWWYVEYRDVHGYVGEFGRVGGYNLIPVEESSGRDEESRLEITAPFSNCEAQFGGSDDDYRLEEVGSNIWRGFNHSNATCNESSGEIYLFVAAMGGSSGDAQDEAPTQNAWASGFVSEDIQIVGSGTVEITVDFNVSGYAVAYASSLNVLLPDSLPNYIFDSVLLLGEENRIISYILNARDVQGVTNEMHGGSRVETDITLFVGVDTNNGSFVEESSVTRTYRSRVNLGNIAGSNDLEELENLPRQIVLEVSVEDGEIITIYSGIRANVDSRGTAFGTWWPTDEYSYVESITLAWSQ